MPGMQVHANVIDDLLSQRFMRPIGAGPATCVVLARCALAVGVAGVGARGVAGGRGIAALVVLAVAWASRAALRARASGCSWRRPVLAVALATFGGTAYQYFVEGREKRQVKQMFSRYVSRDVYDQLMADPGARAGSAARGAT